ncbi:hypothetical protein NIES267_15260 [Calothrix parasitica NIES-267]|uniref:Uncharacterized protein n=1 Tax=Calothrix parasitica NIES-267 TaxID=1973488 RepID=A0A1Z4LLS4_9CYAN|nr:hypothetical protein NIES267_15260 [Calothrix parasitica NIES-267]
MNYNFVRRATSSFIASLFALSFGISDVKPVNSQGTSTLDFCRDNPTLFHLNKGKEKQVKVAVLDFGSNSISTKIGSSPVMLQTNISGLGSVLESKLVHANGVDKNKLTVVRWNSIKSNEKNQYQNTLIKQLRKLRDEHGVEAVIIVNVLGFNTDKSTDNGFVLTKSTKTTTFDIKLNLQVLDTTTGNIVQEFQGHGNKTRKTSTEVKVAFSATINSNIDRQYDGTEQRWKTSSNSRSSIKYHIGDNTKTTTVHKVTNTVTEELLVLATDEALDDITAKLKFNWEELACKLRKPTLVSQVYRDGDEVKVILNKGKSHGYCEEMTFSIEKFPNNSSKEGMEVKDPATGEVLIGFTGEKVGKVTLETVESGYSIGKITSTVPGKSIEIKDVAKISSIPNSCTKTPARNFETEVSSAKVSRSASDLKLQNMFF